MIVWLGAGTTLALAAAGRRVVAIDLPGLIGAGLASLLLAEHIRQQRDRFDVAALPADVGDRDDGDAGAPEARIGRPRAARGDHEHRLCSLRKGVLARRNPARNLQIDDAGIDAVAADHLAQNDLQRRIAHRRIDTQFG